MDLSKINIGKELPWDVNVVIEIPLGGEPVKYEIDKESGALFVDRFLHTAMYYPANYGFIPETLADDGDPLDALVVGNIRVVPGCVIRCRPLGVLLMEDEAGQDEKLIMAPVTKLSPYYANTKDYNDLPEILRDQITHFFHHYKDLEPGKWVKILRWGTAEEAAELIRKTHANYQR
ncbi:MAG: inorganic diphosphatase [Alphaproteobacteria bacterium]